MEIFKSGEQRGSSVIHMPVNDLEVMLSCTIRYAMGRQSYIVSNAIDLFKQYLPYITESVADRIIKEIRDELGRCEGLERTLGANMDHNAWSHLVSEYPEMKYKLQVSY